MMGETQILSEYISDAKYEDLPFTVVDYAKTLIADTIASGLGGRKTQEGDILLDIMKEIGGKPEATVFGDEAKLSFMQAAQVNRVLSNMLDYDETLVKIGHMSSVLVPVALAVGERSNLPGRDIINAIVLGYEVIIRLKAAVEPSEKAFWKTFERVDSGIHFGPTVVAGKLLRLSGRQMADAFGLTGKMRGWRITMPERNVRGMPPWMKVTGGDITIPGIHAVLLAQRGFPGDRAMLDQGRGYEASVGSDRYDATRLTENLGKDYGMLKIGLKYYPACRHISATLDAVAAIVSEHRIKAEDVDQVIVKAQNFVVRDFSLYEPAYMIQAQFSVPYTVAMVLIGEPPGPNWYTEYMLGNPEIRELQHRIKVEEDPVVREKYYRENKYTSTVEIKAKDGKMFSKHVEYPKGDPENPLTQKDHREKLNATASWIEMKQDQIDKLSQTLSRLEELETISELTRLLAPQG
jgi:2-methylcitrate dehydratase PrpD